MSEPVPIDRGRRQTTTARVPPHDIDAEASLLSAMLLNRDAIAEAIEATITPAHFYKPAHGHVYDAICHLYSRGEPADTLTVADELRRRGVLEQAGGEGQLVGIQNAAPSTRNATRYAAIVSDCYLMRRLATVGSAIADLGYGMPVAVPETIDEAESMLFDVRPLTSAVARSLGEGLRPWLDVVETRMLSDGSAEHPMGWVDLDDITGGLHPSHLSIVAARPGMGKTSWAAQLAAKVAGGGEGVLFLSIEMSYDELVGRITCAEAGVIGSDVAKGRVIPNDLNRLVAAIDRVQNWPMEIVDSPTMTLLGARAAARRAAARMGKLGLVIVDYVQLMMGSGRSENRQTEVAELARGLKVLAKELEVPVVALAQLNRGVESRGDKRPNLADLRESGELENSADLVAFIYRDEYYNPHSEYKGMAEVIVAKNRHGPQGTVQLSAEMATGRWRDLTKAGGF